MSYYFIEAKDTHTIIDHVRRPLTGTELAVENDTVEEAVALVCERLERYTLMPSLSPHVQNQPIGKDGELMARGWIQFFGNFEEISAAFSVVTRSSDVIARLGDRIKANHEKHEYKIAKRAWRLERARKDEARR